MKHSGMETRQVWNRVYLWVQSKNIGFGLKSSKWLIFNCPALKGGAIDVRDIQGFSHINKKLWHLFRLDSYN